jgi:hypothetical protein
MEEITAWRKNHDRNEKTDPSAVYGRGCGGCVCVFAGAYGALFCLQEFDSAERFKAELIECIDYDSNRRIKAR